MLIFTAHTDESVQALFSQIAFRFKVVVQLIQQYGGIYNRTQACSEMAWWVTCKACYLVLLARPWGEGGSLFTVGLCLITEDFWSTSARGAREPEKSTVHHHCVLIKHTQNYKHTHTHPIQRRIKNIITMCGQNTKSIHWNCKQCKYHTMCTYIHAFFFYL